MCGSAHAYLWCHIVQCACAGDCALLTQVNGQAKVSQFEAGAIVGKQDVLRLDVAVDDGARVQVLREQQVEAQRGQHFCEAELRATHVC